MWGMSARVKMAKTMESANVQMQAALSFGAENVTALLADVQPSAATVVTRR